MKGPYNDSMRLIMVFTLLISSAFAQERAGLDDIIKVLANPAKALNDPRCEERNNTDVNACRSLSSAVCGIKNPQSSLRDLQKKTSSYETIPFGKLTLPSLETIERVEREVFETSIVKQSDLVELFGEVRVSMLNAIDRNDALTRAEKSAMKEKIQTVQFMSGSEYVRNRESRPNEGETQEQARLKGIRNYADKCGNGSLVSAYNQMDKVVLCPGLIQSLMDFNPRSKREVLNSLAFTVGHELAHSIDASPDRFPEPYHRMQNCYNNLAEGTGQFESRGPEISADYWGSQIFAERLRADNITGEEAVRALALAADDFCSFPDDSMYPSGKARLDLTIGRDPSIRQSLGCEPPSREAPVCTMAGTIPFHPPSVARSK